MRLPAALREVQRSLYTTTVTYTGGGCPSANAALGVSSTKSRSAPGGAGSSLESTAITPGAPGASRGSMA